MSSPQARDPAQTRRIRAGCGVRGDLFLAGNPPWVTLMMSGAQYCTTSTAARLPAAPGPQSEFPGLQRLLICGAKIL
jgi:hypothetical protein